MLAVNTKSLDVRPEEDTVDVWDLPRPNDAAESKMTSAQVSQPFFLFRFKGVQTRIGPANAEAVDAGSLMAIGRPRSSVNGHSKTSSFERDCSQNYSLYMDVCGERDTPTSWVGLVKLDIRRNSLVFQRKDGFNDRAQTRCALRMTYIRLGSPDINMSNTT